MWQTKNKSLCLNAVYQKKGEGLSLPLFYCIKIRLVRFVKTLNRKHAAPVRKQVREQVWVQVDHKVWNQVDHKVCNQVWDQVCDQVRGQVYGQVGLEVRRQIRG